ncbi:MAG TPA: hypothetical protein VEX68_26085 [Bryobacteraceae bacterium]|nr:hypothetical protein [Bryobacteraceae bacterium]
MNASAWELLRAVRGPILLMTFGVLVALNHTGKMDFERTWPVLIIVYGFLKLIERMVPRPVPPPWQPPVGAYPVATPPSAARSYTPEYPQYPPPQSREGGAQ